MKSPSTTAVTSPAGWNCKVVADPANKLSFTVGSKAEVVVGRSKFKNLPTLVEFVSTSFGLTPTEGSKSIAGAIRRAGKYQRVDSKGNPVFTFGDPIADLITDEQGVVTVGSEQYDLRGFELTSSSARRGGSTAINFTDFAEDGVKTRVAAAIRGDSRDVIVRCSDGLVVLASNNPSQIDHYLNGKHLRFKAWRKNYFLYWSMGAEIETWGKDFSKASIESQYFDTFVGGYCAVVKADSDSDSNDDYVDEYEWGVNAPQPVRVESFCRAEWQSQVFTGRVSAGANCPNAFPQ